MKIILLPLLPLLLASPEKLEFRENVHVEMVTVDPFSVVGVYYIGTDIGGVFTAMNEFLPRRHEVRDSEPTDPCYGIVFSFDPETREFGYLLGVESELKDDMPEGMGALDVEGGEFALFNIHIDNTISEIYDYATLEWLPASPYTIGDSFSFEFYPSEITCPEDSFFKLYLSVKPRTGTEP